MDLHQYGRLLLAEKKDRDALEIFRLNYERNGDQWPVHVGLARGYAANGDPKQALEHARKALAQAPDALNRQSLEAMIAALEAGRVSQGVIHENIIVMHVAGAEAGDAAIPRINKPLVVEGRRALSAQPTP